MMRSNESFSSYIFRSGLLADFSDSEFPTRIHAMAGNHSMVLGNKSTYYVYVYSGVAYHNSKFPILRGMYACLTDGYITTHEDSQALVIEKLNFKGMTTYGGPLEDEGRLKYIDGCTDSILIHPVKKGDPCLNHLHFPVLINQTMHTHPSIRVGVVAQGAGECITPFGNIDLRPGMIFVIKPENGKKAVGLDGNSYLVGSHCFKTEKSTMRIVAWHPDSDVGPTDQEHPMISRTIVDGVSAKYLNQIQTK